MFTGHLWVSQITSNLETFEFILISNTGPWCDKVARQGVSLALSSSVLQMMRLIQFLPSLGKA